MKCINCGNELREGVKFCSSCGTKVEEEKQCPKCGYKLEENDKFCSQCGTKYEIKAEKSVVIEMWEKAKNNDPEMQHSLAIKFEQGKDIEQSDELAIFLYLQALKGGNKDAMLPLAEYFYYGTKVDEDEDLARDMLLVSLDNDKAVEKLQEWFDIEKDGYKWEDSLQEEAEKNVEYFISRLLDDVNDDIREKIKEGFIEQIEDDVFDVFDLMMLLCLSDNNLNDSQKQGLHFSSVVARNLREVF